LIPEFVTHNQREEEFLDGFEYTSGYMRPERVNKWPISMTDIYDDDDYDGNLLYTNFHEKEVPHMKLVLWTSGVTT
jgi:hypothetical protein